MRLEAEARRRSEEIGALLAEARAVERRSITECANLIGTSRKRYRGIEAGTTEISFLELEALVSYLNLPFSSLSSRVAEDALDRRIVVQAQQGQTLHLVLEFGQAAPVVPIRTS